MLRRLLLGVVASALLTFPVVAAEIDPVLPAETEMVVRVNVRQILDCELVKKYAAGQMKQALEGNDAQEMLKLVGLDPMKDVNLLTVGLWGKKADDLTTVFAIRGKFDAEKLVAALKLGAKEKKSEYKIIEEDGVVLMETTQKGQGPGKNKPVFMAVASNDVIIGASDKKLALTLVDSVKKNEKSAVKKELTKLMGEIDDKTSVCIGAIVEGKSEELEIPKNALPGVDSEKLAKQLKNVANVVLTLNVTDGVTLNLSAGMKDTDSADEFGETVAQTLEKVTPFIGMISSQNPKLKGLADDLTKTLKSKVKDKNVSIGLKVTGDSIGKAAGDAKMGEDE